MSDDEERYIAAVCEHLTNTVLAAHSLHSFHRDSTYEAILASTKLKLFDGHRASFRVAEEILDSAFGPLPSFGRGVDTLVESGRRRRRVWNAASEASYEHDQLLTELLAPAKADETIEQLLNRGTSAILKGSRRNIDHAIQRNRSVALRFLVTFMIVEGVALVILGVVLDQWVAAIIATIGVSVSCYLGVKSFDPYDH